MVKLRWLSLPDQRCHWARWSEVLQSITTLPEFEIVHQYDQEIDQGLDQKSDNKIAAINILALSSEHVTDLEKHAWFEFYLKEMLANAHLVILVDLEKAAIDAQMFWSKWLSKQACDVKVLRMQNNQMAPASQQLLIECLQIELPRELKQRAWRRYRIAVSKLSLNNLNMALSHSIELLGRQILYVSGQVETYEYAHPVKLNMTILGWQMSPLETLGGETYVEFWAEENAQTWLQEIVDAAQF